MTEQDKEMLERQVELLRRMSPRLDMLDCENVLTAADRIEDLVEERDDYKDLYYAAFKDAASLNIHYAEIGYKAKTAEAKLAKAVEMLILCGDMFDEVAHPSDPLSVMIKTTLAELEGK